MRPLRWLWAALGRFNETGMALRERPWLMTREPVVHRDDEGRWLYTEWKDVGGSNGE